MQRTLNLRVKHRESFRPFAPAILAEDVSEWFKCDRASPYMLFVVEVDERRRNYISAEEEEAQFGIDKLKLIAPRFQLSHTWTIQHGSKPCMWKRTLVFMPCCIISKGKRVARSW